MNRSITIVTVWSILKLKISKWKVKSSLSSCIEGFVLHGMKVDFNTEQPLESPQIIVATLRRLLKQMQVDVVLDANYSSTLKKKNNNNLQTLRLLPQV